MNALPRYQFVIEGELSERAQAAFPDLTISRWPGLVTTMYGTMGDSTSVRSVLARLDALGLTVVELRRLPD